MNAADAFMRFLLVGLPVAAVLGFILRKISKSYGDTAFKGFGSLRELLSHYTWAASTLWQRKWLLLLPCALLLTTRAAVFFQQVGARRYIIETHGRLPEWWLIKDYFLQTLPGRIPEVVLISIREMGGGFTGVFGAGAVIITLLALIALSMREKVLGDLAEYAGSGGPEGIAFLRRFMGIALKVVIPLAVAGAAALLARASGLVVVLGCAMLFAVGVVLLVFIALISGFVLFYLKQVWARRAPDCPAALAGSLEIVYSLAVVRLVIGVVLRLADITMLPVSLYTFMGRVEGAGPELAQSVHRAVSVYCAPPAAILSLLTVCAAFPLLVGAKTPWEAFLWNFRFVGKYLVRYLTLVATGVAVLSAYSLLSLILVTMANSLSYPGMVVEFLLDCVFLGGLMVFLLACFKFFMDRRGGVSPAP